MPALSLRRPRLKLLGAVVLVFAMANPAWAPPGDLDPTFDGDGKVTTDFGAGDSAEAVAMQADGKIVVAGYTSTAPDFALARYNPDGSLDTAFDGDGRVTTDFSGGQDQAFVVAIQGDGKIVAAGEVFSGARDFALARYNADGSLDATFDGDGKVTTDFAGNADLVNAVAIQGDGKIVAAGRARVSGAGDRDFVLARYNADGSLDTAFDGDGKVNTDFASDSEDVLSAVAIQSDGMIVAAGCLRCFDATSDFALARYKPDGSLDTAFDGDGKVTTDFAGSADEATGVAIQGDGRIVAAGHALISGGTYDFALAGYNADGSPDTTLDGDGRVTTDFAVNDDQAFAMAIQGDGRIVAAGCVSCFVAGPTVDFALARYNANGALDTTFSTDGKVTTDFAGSDDQAFAMAIQANGRIVAAGFAGLASGDNDFAVARYTCVRRTSRPMSIPLCP